MVTGSTAGKGHRYSVLLARLLPAALLCTAFLIFPPLSGKSSAVTSSIPEWYMFDRCTDLQDRLTFEQEVTIEGMCDRLKDKHDVASVVYIDDKLTGRTCEEFADELAEAWKLGDDTNGRWVVLAIFTEDRRMRLGCSPSLDNILPGDLSLYIIDNKFGPFFKKEQYFEGITTGITAIDSALAGKFRKPLKQRITSFFRNLSTEFREIMIFVALGLTLVVVIIASGPFEGGSISSSGHFGGWFGGGGGFGGGFGGGGIGGGGATGGW